MKSFLQSICFGAIAGTGGAAGDYLEHHTVNVATVCAILAVVIPAAFYVARKFQQAEDRFEGFKTELDRIESEINAVKTDIESLQLNEQHRKDKHEK